MKNHPNVPDAVREMFSMQTARSSCVNCETLRNELERLRRLAPSGTYTLNVPYEEEIQRLKAAGEVLVRSLERMTKERDEAQAIAKQYELDWYAAKSEFGTAMAKMRDALRAAEKRELEALAELDEARAELKSLRALIDEAHRELSTIEAITVSPSDTDGLIDLVRRLKENAPEAREARRLARGFEPVSEEREARCKYLVKP